MKLPQYNIAINFQLSHPNPAVCVQYGVFGIQYGVVTHWVGLRDLRRGSITLTIFYQSTDIIHTEIKDDQSLN